MYLAKMWHLMKAHRKRTKITKIIPTWPSPQLAPPSPAPAAPGAVGAAPRPFVMPSSLPLGPPIKGGSGKNGDTDDLGGLTDGLGAKDFSMDV